MIILFDATKPHKPSRSFGQGLATARSERPSPGPTAEDRAWAAYELNKDCRDYSVVGREPAWHERAARHEHERRADISRNH